VIKFSNLRIEQNENEISLVDLNRKYAVTMVTWNCDDSLVITAQNNSIIKVWNSKTGQLIYELKVIITYCIIYLSLFSRSLIVMK
jgi:hypothetical protein